MMHSFSTVQYLMHTFKTTTVNNALVYLLQDLFQRMYLCFVFDVVALGEAGDYRAAV